MGFLPMYQPTYFSPGPFIHCFLMFAPFFLTRGFVFKLLGAFLFFTGPVLSTFITPNLGEQASIWCFFSVSQILVMTAISISTGFTPPFLRKLEAKQAAE